MGIANNNHTKYNKLSALISKGSFFYSTSDSFNEEIESYGHFEIPNDNSVIAWENLFKSNGLEAYRQIKLAYAEPRFTLIPGDLYLKKDVQTYHENAHPTKPNETVAVDTLKGLDIRIVYPIANNLHTALGQTFSNFKSYHILNPIVCHLNKITLGKLGHMLNVHVLGEYLIVTLFNGRNIEFSNFFKFKTSDDFLYYVMLIYKRFNLDPEITPTYLSGHFTEKAEFFPKLYRYVRNLEYTNTAKEVQLTGDLAKHQIFDLYGLSTCV